MTARPKEEVSRQKENFNLLGLGLPSLNLVPRYAISKTKVLEGDTQREPDGRTNEQPRFSTRLPHQHDANANDHSAAPPAGQTGPTLRQEYVAGSVAPEKTTIALDSPHDRHISHARDGDGSKVSPRRGTSLLASLGVRQTCADRAVGGKSGCVLYL